MKIHRIGLNGILLPIVVLTNLMMSCNPKGGKNEMQKTLIARCDELDIIYYTKDSLVFRIFNKSTIKKYIEMIKYDNDPSISNFEANGRLIFKQKGKQLFTVDISTEDNKENISVKIARYKIGSKEYKHLLTADN